VGCAFQNALLEVLATNAALLRVEKVQ